MKHVIWLLIALLLTSCAISTQQDNRYQHASVEESHTAVGPVAELHRKAIAALAQDKSKQSIEYLQRAIKIEPRNAFSWHYLAQSYWHHQDYEKCLDMIERSFSYSSAADDLDRANRALKLQCQAS